MAHHQLGALLGEADGQFTLDLFKDLRRRGALQCLGEELDDDAALCHAGAGEGHHLRQGSVEGTSVGGQTVHGSDGDDDRWPRPPKGWSVELTRRHARHCLGDQTGTGICIAPVEHRSTGDARLVDPDDAVAFGCQLRHPFGRDDLGVALLDTVIDDRRT